MVALAMAVILPIIALQLYKIYVGQISFGVQLGLVVVISVLWSGPVLHLQIIGAQSALTSVFTPRGFRTS